MNNCELDEALVFAGEKHSGQKYGEQDYMVHVRAVVALALETGLSREAVLAAALHDTLEDTDTTRQELVSRFGAKVAALVYAVTGEGANRVERQRSIVRKLLTAPAAVDLKLCDRIANVEAAKAEGKTGLVDMYRKEMRLYEPAFRLGQPALFERLTAAFD
jgi:(p)ppGpp synthase/HD superfamily hydrolase